MTQGMEERLALLEAKEGIRETISSYAHYVDSGRYGEWGELFTEDGIFDVSFGGRLQGREQIVSFLKARHGPKGPKSRHFIMNHLIQVSGNRATASSYFAVTNEDEDTSIFGTGVYQDRLRKDGDRWRFVERKVVVDYMVPLEKGWGGTNRGIHGVPSKQ